MTTRRRFVAPAMLVLVIVLFHWRLWMTSQYTWIESPDLASQVLPQYQFSASEVHRGRLPLWDPYSWGGQPLHAGMQASLAYPLHWLLLAAPLNKNGWLLGLALNWYYILIRCFVALAMYALCRDLGRSAWAATLAGLIYSLGGVEITTDWPQMAHAAAWAPIVFLFLFRVLRGASAVRTGVYAGAALGAAWLCGHHAYPAFITMAAVGVWIYWLVTRDRFTWTLLKAPAICFLFTGLVSAVQTLPTAEFSRLAVRWVGAENPLHWNEKIPYHLYESFSMSADGLFSFIFPSIGQSYEPFLGVCACGLAMFGAAVAWRDQAVRVVSMIGAGGLIYALASFTPVHGWMYALMPLAEKTRVPVMATLLTSVAVAVLAAFALDFVLSLERSVWYRRFSIGLSVFGLGILLLGSILFARRAEVMNGPNLFLLTGIYAVMLAVWLMAALHRKLTPNWIAFCPVALVLAELTHGPSSLWRNQLDHSKPNILLPLAEDYKLVEYLRSERGSWRVETDLPYSFGQWWGIETIDGIGAGVTANLYDSNIFSPRMREFMSVRFRIAEKPLRDDQRQVFEGARGVKIFENQSWLPRTWIVHEAVIEPNPESLRNRLISDGFSPRRQVLLRTAPPAMESCQGIERAELGRRLASRVEVKVEMNCRGMLILNDVYYPGWIATVDGQQQPIYEAYGVVRGVMLDKGAHKVVFQYSPWSVKLGALLTLVGLSGIVFARRMVSTIVNRSMKSQVTLSLGEVHGSVGTDSKGFWRRMFAFAGPAYLISVGYMDPGNWATDLEGGARFGYRLLWVLVLSNAMAILLQTLSARLGIVTQSDLAQACRKSYPRLVSVPLWIFCEIAIAACDLAEILGAAIGLKLLFGIPLMAGVLITAADTVLLLWLNRLGMRAMEAFVLALIAVMAACFGAELWMAKPVWTEIASGLVPRLDGKSLYVAISILGATVMPHNMYLHSALVQTRRIGKSIDDKRKACFFNFLDSAVALNGAMLVNAAILVLAASVFFKNGVVVTRIEQAHEMLTPLLGTTVASAVFAIALLCSGQSSTLTGTMAGQVVMEGFLNFRIQPWLRRVVTRVVALIPAVLTVWQSGETGTYKLIILSQVILSLQLPFAIVPLIHFTSDRERMGELVNPRWVKGLGWLAAAAIIGLNFWLARDVIQEWADGAGPWIWLVVGPVAALLLVLLAFVSFEPWLPAKLRGYGRPVDSPQVAPEVGAAPVYKRILVPLDHTPLDQVAVAHAVAMARMHGAQLFLLHVEEGVTSQFHGSMASTAEVEYGRQYFEAVAENIEKQSVVVDLAIVHARNPAAAIVQYAREMNADLVIMGAHGHRGLKDLIFGTTISAVRHGVRAPLFVVSAPLTLGRACSPGCVQVTHSTSKKLGLPNLFSNTYNWCCGCYREHVDDAPALSTPDDPSDSRGLHANAGNHARASFDQRYVRSVDDHCGGQRS